MVYKTTNFNRSLDRNSVIPFNKPYMTGNEIANIFESYNNGVLAGDGAFTKKCHKWLEENCHIKKALLTHSCTAALEMAAILLNISPGDEVIMPSYTFVSTANAFVLRGAVPVFVDIRPDTLNIDEEKIEEAITSKTKAIVPVHYAGVACEMDQIMDIATKHKLAVVEDAAQALGAYYKGKPLGSIGHLGALSFHETKNIISGEGGALLINDAKFLDRAEIIREKGTNRSRFFRGEVDKYTWVDIGSSYLPGELIAAFLYAQLGKMDSITAARISLWNTYHEQFAEGESLKKWRRPIVPEHCQHNAHMYYLLLPSLEARESFIHYLKQHGINSIFHYIPLHSSEAGKKFARYIGDMAVTNSVSDRLVRLPLWIGLDHKMNEIVDLINRFSL